MDRRIFLTSFVSSLAAMPLVGLAKPSAPAVSLPRKHPNPVGLWLFKVGPETITAGDKPVVIMTNNGEIYSLVAGQTVVLPPNWSSRHLVNPT